jgi:hypothetical protein
LLRHQILVERKAQERKNVADDSSAHENCVFKIPRYFKTVYYQEIESLPKTPKNTPGKTTVKSARTNGQQTTMVTPRECGMQHTITQ